MRPYNATMKNIFMGTDPSGKPLAYRLDVLRASLSIPNQGFSKRGPDGKLQLGECALKFDRLDSTWAVCSVRDSSNKKLVGYYSREAYLSPDTRQTQDLLDECTKGFYAKGADYRSNLAEALATRQQTADMLTSTANRLARAYRFLRKGKARKALGALGLSRHAFKNGRDNAPGRWLELQYGWLPMIGTVYQALQFKPITKAWIKVYRKVVYYRTISETAVLLGNVGKAYTSGSTETRITVKGNFLCDDPILRSFASSGITNPVSLAWELLPYSFVVDWFIPIGPYLELAGVVPFLKWTNSSTTTTHRLTTEFAWAIPNVTSVYPGRSTRVMKERVLYVPTLPPPRIRNGLNLTRFANALSLLALAFGRRGS